MTANFILFHIGLAYTTASHAMVLENTAPIFVLVALALFFKERIRKSDVLAVIITFLGICIVVMGMRNEPLLTSAGFMGDMLELGAGALWAIFLVGSSKYFTQGSGISSRLLSLLRIFLVTAIMLTPWMLFGIRSIRTNDALLLLALGVFPTALAFWFWYEAAARLSTIAAALMFNLSIVFTFINAHFFLHEKMTYQLLVGAALITTAITLTKTKRATDANTSPLIDNRP
jgi:drug/metabolite transporter (DMT)-like permease